MQTHLVFGCSALALLLMSSGQVRARPMHVLNSTPDAQAVMHGRNMQYIVRFDGPVDHAQSQGSATLSTDAPLEQFVESGESGGISVLAEC